MKICLINNLYKPYNRGGAESVVRAQRKGFAKLGHEVFVVSLKPRKKSEQEPEKHEEAVYYLKSAFPNLKKMPRGFRFFYHIIDFCNLQKYCQIKNIISKEKPDLVLTNNLKGLGLSLVKLFDSQKVKHIHVLHDIQLLHPSGLMFFGQEKKIDNFPSRVYQLLGQKFFRSVKFVSAPSKWLLEEHLNRGFFPQAKKQVILNPLPLDIKREGRGTGRKKRFRVLLISHVSESKGIKTLLSVLEKVARKNLIKEIELTIAGKHLDKSIEISSRGKLKIIPPHFYSHQELSKLINQSDCLVQPSLCYENSPSSIYMAAICEKPFIASSIGGSCELVKRFGGLSFAPDSSADLANQIEKVIKNPDQFRSRLNIKDSYVKKLLELVT